MNVYCDTYSTAGLSGVLIPGKQDQVIVVTAITIQKEDATDSTVILQSGGVASGDGILIGRLVTSDIGYY